MKLASASTPGVHEETPGKQAPERQERALHEQLPDDAPAARADRDANADLPLARRRPRQQHVRHIAAGNHQQEAHGAEERVQHAPELADHPIDDRDHLEAIFGRIVAGVLALLDAPR